jgi:hypothetical protein
MLLQCIYTHRLVLSTIYLFRGFLARKYREKLLGKKHQAPSAKLQRSTGGKLQIPSPKL